MFTDPLELSQRVIEDMTQLQDLIRDLQLYASARQERINRIAPVVMAARRVVDDQCAGLDPTADLFDRIDALARAIEEFDRQDKAPL